MLSYAFDRNGNFIHWSPLAVMDNHEQLFKDSLRLPLPNKNKIITLDYNSNHDDKLIEVLQQYSQLDKYDLLGKAKLLREINTFDRLILNKDEYDAYSKVIEEINSHNNYLNKLKLGHNDISENIKNFISFNMFDIIANPVNVIQAQSSIDDAVKIFKNRADNTEKAKVSDRNQPGNSYSKMLELSTNMTGKAVISISAASMKAMLGITNATNHALNTLDPNEIINVIFDIDVLGVSYTIAGNSYSEVLTTKRFNFAERIRQANSLKNPVEKAEELARIAQDKANFNTMAASVLTNVKNEEDILLMLSALLSLATDNAKELVLDKINAGSELVSLYVAGITLGVPFTDLTDIIISPTIDTISKIMKEDSFNDYSGMSRFGQVIDYINKGPNSLFGSILKKEVYIKRFVIALEEAAKIGSQSSVLKAIKESIEEAKKSNTSIYDENEPNDDIFYQEPSLEDYETKETITYNSYHLRKMLTSLKWTPEMVVSFLNNLNQSDSDYRWIRLIDDLEKWFDIKEIINNDIIVKKAEIIDDSLISDTSQQLSSIRKFDEAVKLYRASTEMTSLVGYFGLNQGIPTDPNELINIRTKFETMFENAINFKDPNNKETIYKGTKMTVSDAVKNIKINKEIFPEDNNYKISMSKFFADKNYRNEIVEAYNAIKEFQNIPYILIHNEHYYSYLELVSILINIYSKVSKKFKTINDFANRIIEMINVYKSDEKLRVLKSIENSIDTIINNTWMSTTFEPFMIPEGVISIDATSKPYTTTAPTPIILGTDWGNKAFKFYIEQKVIPDLQAGRLGPNIVRSLGNRLLNALTPMIDSDVTNNMDIVYTLPIEMIPKTPEEDVIFNSYKDSLSNLRSVQYDNGLEKHSVINLLYLYNMVTYNNKVSKYALTGLFGSLIQGHNLDIHEKYIKFIADYDNNNVELKGFNLESIAQRAAPIGYRFNAKTNMVKELNPSTGKYVLYKKGENGYQYRNYTALSTGNMFKHNIVLSPDITIIISSNGELESILTNKGSLNIDEYNKTVTEEYQVKSKEDLLVKYKQIVNNTEIDTLDIKLTLENINRILNNPC